MKAKKTFMLMLIAVGMVMNYGATVEAAGKYVKSLSVQKNVTVTEGESRTVKVKVKANKKTAKKLNVKVKNTRIAKVKYNNNKGILTVKGINAGTTKVTLTTKAKNKKGKKLKKIMTIQVLEDSEDYTEDNTYYEDYNDREIINDNSNSDDVNGGNEKSSGDHGKNEERASNQTTENKRINDNSSTESRWTEERTTERTSTTEKRNTEESRITEEATTERTSENINGENDNSRHSQDTDTSNKDTSDTDSRSDEKEKKRTDIASDDITMWWKDGGFSVNLNMSYTGEPLTPEIRLYYQGSRLLENVDYTVEYKDNVNVGIASAVITGIGDYCGSRTDNFEIIKAYSYPQVKPWKSTLDVGESVKIEIDGIYGDVEYSVTDENVASIDSNGVLTAKANGFATVRADITWDENHRGSSNSITLGICKVGNKEAEYCGFSVSIKSDPDSYRLRKHINRDNDGIYETSFDFVSDTHEDWIDENVTFEIEDVTPKQIKQIFKDLGVESNHELELEVQTGTYNYRGYKEQFMEIEKKGPITYKNYIMSSKTLTVRAGITTRAIKVTAKVNGKVVDTMYTGGGSKTIFESEDYKLCTELRHRIESKLWTDDMSNYEKLKVMGEYLSSTTHYPGSASVSEAVNPTLWDRYGIDGKGLCYDMMSDVLMNTFALYQGGFAKCTAVSTLRAIAIDDLGIVSDHTAEGESVWIGSGSYSSAPYNPSHSSLIYQFEDGSRAFIDMEGTHGGSDCKKHGCLDRIISVAD